MKIHYINKNTDNAVSSVQNEQWDSYVNKHPNGTIYHTIAWKNIVEKCFNKITFYFYVEDAGKIIGLLPIVNFSSKLFGRFMVSFPYVNYGGMLFDNEDVKNFMLEEAHKILQSTGSDSIELRSMQENEFDLPVKSSKVTYYLSLPFDADNAEEALMKQFKAKLRSQIRKPMKEGMTAKIVGLEGLTEFYEIFAYKMRELGTPVYAKDFFKTILNELPGNAKIILVYSKEKIPVAGAFVIHNKGMMEIPWAATLRKYDRLSPNMLLYFEVLKYAMSLKCHTFDFGRCTKNSGTYRFKKQWGGEEETLYWYYILKQGTELPEVNPNNPKYQLAIKIWQKCPLFMTKLIGPLLIKDIP